MTPETPVEPRARGLEWDSVLGDDGEVNETLNQNPEGAPWSAEGIREASEALASAIGALPREDRSSARLLIRRAWMAAESGLESTEQAFVLGRELDRWLRRARGCPEAERGWLDRGGYFSLRRKRRIRAPRGIDWMRVNVLEERGLFHLDRQARHDWLWERCTDRSTGGRSTGEVESPRRELPAGLELVWSDATD